MKKIFLFSILAGVSKIYAQGVGVNSTGASPNASAMLDVKSSDKGVLIPRVILIATNIAAPVITPETSLMVYNTATGGTGSTAVTPGFYFWNGLEWEKVITGNTINITDNQNLTGASLSGTNLQIDIENGASATVDLSNLQDGTGTDSQTLSLSGNTLSISGGNNVTLTDNVNDADNIVGNEYNTGASLSGTTLSITDGGGAQSVNLSSLQDGTGTDSQTLSLSGNTLSISGGNNVTLTDNVNDADNIVGNEYNTGASLSGTTLSITDGGGAQSVNLAPLKDHDWYKVGGTTQATAITDNIFTSGSVGIGAIVPSSSAVLDVASTSKGALFPRMSEAQKNAIATPATGLLVYQLNSTNGFYYYDGSQWMFLGTGSSYSPESLIYTVDGF